MAKIKYETLSMNDSTEVEFMTNVINYLLTVDSRISLMSDIDAEFETFAEEYDSDSTYSIGDYCIYDDKTMICNTAITTPEEYDSSKWTESTKRATFDFNIDNKFILRLKRDQQNNTYGGSDGYVPILCDLNGNVVMNISDYAISYNSSGSGPIASHELMDRVYKVMTIIDPNLIGLWIIPFCDTIFVNSVHACCAIMEFVDTDSESWVVTRERSRIFVNTDPYTPSIAKKCSNFAVTGSVARMFNYSAEAGYIDYLSRVIIKNEDGYKMAETKTLCSSTNTTPGVSYGLASGSFMSIDANALVKVDND